MKRARSETTIAEADTQMSEAGTQMSEAGTQMQLSDCKNDNAAFTEQQDQTSHLINACDAIDNGTAREIAQAAKTMQSRSVRFMWAYFNSWITGDANDAAPRCTVVPMTRRLRHEEEAILVEYFCDPGPKCIPSGLPHAHKGKSCVRLTAQAAKEMVKLTADKGIENVALVHVTNLESDDSVAHAGCMYVKRVKVMGKEELVDLCTRAGLGGC
jgi:hypothetical protein